MNYNHLINSLKISTKIWRCHVMFLINFYAKIYFIHEIFWTLHSIFLLWSRVHFCTTTHLNNSFWPPPKLWDDGNGLRFHIMQKPRAVLWKIWVNQPHFHSGPTWWFVQQPYFYLLFNPWLFLLLVVPQVKPLSLGACTFWIIFGSWNNVIYLLSRIGVL